MNWCLRSVGAIGMIGLIVAAAPRLRGQEAAEEPPPVPQGVEVLARGPVHEAFAPATTDPVPTKPVPKQPPKALEELPPAEKPEGNVVWIAGYWAWDDERNDFLWVSGVWRSPPAGKRWVAGYWRQDGTNWQWVPGFWAAEAKDEVKQEVVYLPAPPAAPEVAPPGQPPNAESFYVPGHWEWTGSGYAWRAGYWAKVQPGYVWVPAHYRWTPSGYVFVAGYWDLPLAARGVIYAPVVVDPAVVTATFVYTPAYVVRETVVVDSLFVRPCTCHYYFGDYYSVTYRDLGFESAIIYSRRHYEPIVVYQRYEYRHVPDWERTQVNIFIDRSEGRAPRPPRTLVQQNVVVKNVTNVTNVNQTIVNNPTTVNQVLVPASKLAAEKGTRTVPLDSAARNEVKQQAQTVQKVSAERKQTEVAVAPSQLTQPRKVALDVPKTQPVATRAPAADKPNKPATTRPPAEKAPVKPAEAAKPPANPTPPRGTGPHPPTDPKVKPAEPPSKPGEVRPTKPPEVRPTPPGSQRPPVPPPATKPPPPSDKDKKKKPPDPRM